MKTVHSLLIGGAILALGATGVYAYSLYTHSTPRGISQLTDTSSSQYFDRGHRSGRGRGMQDGGMRGADATHSETPLSIANIASGSLDETEKSNLLHQYREEMVARDLYTAFSTLYPSESSFSNVASSEQQHMDTMGALLERYSIPRPTEYGDLQSTYDSLKSEGSKSLQSALEVGLKVEMLDIDDIRKALAQTDNADIKASLDHIGSASFNHLRGFSMGLQRNNLQTTVDISAYLSGAELQSRGNLRKDITQ